MYIISSDTNYTYENSDGILQKTMFDQRLTPERNLNFAHGKSTSNFSSISHYLSFKVANNNYPKLSYYLKQTVKIVCIIFFFTCSVKGPSHDLRSNFFLFFIYKMVYFCILNDLPQFKR